jgi:hypothetical protein
MDGSIDWEREDRERRAGGDDGFLWSLQAARVLGERGGVAARRSVAGRHVCLGPIMTWASSI